jgi:hypothetical protein
LRGDISTAPRDDCSYLTRIVGVQLADFAPEAREFSTSAMRACSPFRSKAGVYRHYQDVIGPLVNFPGFVANAGVF